MQQSGSVTSIVSKKEAAIPVLDLVWERQRKKNEEKERESASWRRGKSLFLAWYTGMNSCILCTQITLSKKNIYDEDLKTTFFKENRPLTRDWSFYGEIIHQYNKILNIDPLESSSFFTGMCFCCTIHPIYPWKRNALFLCIKKISNRRKHFLCVFLWSLIHDIVVRGMNEINQIIYLSAQWS